MIIFLDWRRERVEEFRSLEVEDDYKGFYD
jgi:hypothetical protein